MDWTPYLSKDYPTENFIHVLPNEAILYVFSYLEVRDVRNVRCVNTEWRDFTDDNVLWKELCHNDFDVYQKLEDSWKATYLRLEELLAEGTWEGMSKWVEPEGFDNEQQTTAKLQFYKRKPSNLRIASPSMIRRVDSTANSSTLRIAKDDSATPKFQESDFRISGTGVTINCSAHSIFRIEGERVAYDSNGATFRWHKQFEKHTSVYLGKIDYAAGTMNGTIDYHDGTTHWKGIFAYTKINRKYSKMEEARVA